MELTITNHRNEPVSNASVEMHLAKDSTTPMHKVADKSGLLIVWLHPNKEYVFKASAVNYQPGEKTVLITGQQQQVEIFLEPMPSTLNAVVVTARKPLMRQEDDKTIVDPENLATSSTNAYEIIEKTPGMFVDQDGNVYLNSTTPAMIYINGREMKMSTADIATMLKSLPPNAILQIEILRTPSARYDASGTGGIVNIVLRKGIRIGLTGSVTAGMQQGKYGNQLAGLTLNNTSGGLSSYINLNYNHRDSYEQLTTNRIFSVDSLLQQKAYTRLPGNSIYGGYGIGYNVKKWDLSYDGRLSFNNSKSNSENHSTISNNISKAVFADNTAFVNNKGDGFLTSQGLTAKYKTDSSGIEWANDFSWVYANNHSSQEYNTLFTAPIASNLAGNGHVKNDRNNFIFQSDFSKKFNKKLALETGIKSSYLRFNSQTAFFKNQTTTAIPDISRTSTFRYTEQIHAAYIQASQTFMEDLVLKAGTRMEHTNMQGKQLVPGDTSFSVKRTDFFPYVFLSKKLVRISGYDFKAYLVYRRTIARPVYEQLNPFPRYIDQYLSETGNPSLRPQFTQNYEANISVDNHPIFAVGTNETKDIFTNVIYQSDSSGSTTYRTFDNLGSNKEWYFRGMGVIPPGKRYFLVLGAQYNHNNYNGLYENKPLTFKKGSWTFFTYQTFRLDKLSQIVLNGFMRVNGQLQFYELSNFGALNASINRQFLNKKLMVTLSINDMFYSNKNKFVLQQGSIDASGYRQADTRRWGINFRYNFGIQRKEKANNPFNNAEPEG